MEVRLTRNPKILIGGSMLVTSGFFYILSAASFDRLPTEFKIGVLIPWFIGGAVQTIGLLEENKRRKLEKSSVNIATPEPN